MKKQKIKEEYENDNGKKAHTNIWLQSARKKADPRELVKKSIFDFGYTSRERALHLFKKENKD